MMKLYKFYIFKSVIVTSLLSVGLFVFVLLTGNAIRDVLGLLASSHLSWGTFFELILLLIPYVFTFALPLGILTGILIVLGRMSSSQEIIVLKSAGESTWSIVSPVVAVALIGAAVSAQINNYQAPEAFRRYRTLLPNVFREDPLSFIEIGKPIHEFPGYVLYIRKKQGNQLEDIWIWELDKRHRAVVLVRARHGEIKYNRDSDSLVLTARDGFAELRNQENPDDLKRTPTTVSFRETDGIRLPLGQLLGRIPGVSKPAAFNLNELIEKWKFYNQELEKLKTRSKLGDPEYRVVESEKIKYELRIHKNFAMAASVISLGLIAIPLGIKVGRKEAHANIALALALAFVYYFLMVIVGWFETRPELHPEILIWLPNLGFQSVGICLIIRENRSC